MSGIALKTVAVSLADPQLFVADMLLVGVWYTRQAEEARAFAPHELPPEGTEIQRVQYHVAL